MADGHAVDASSDHLEGVCNSRVLCLRCTRTRALVTFHEEDGPLEGGNVRVPGPSRPTIGRRSKRGKGLMKIHESDRSPLGPRRKTPRITNYLVSLF